jgi:predicted ATPase
MIRRLRVQNFKPWQDTQSVRLAPLTILFGVNSSGKSSINHLLMMLRQTVRSPDRKSVLDLGDPDSPVQLGTFRDLVFEHDLARELKFEVEWELPAAMNVRDPYSRDQYAGNRIVFEGSVRQAPAGRTLQSQGFSYRLLDDDQLSIGVTFERDQNRTDRWRIEDENYRLVRTKGRAWELPKPVKFYGFPNETSIYFQNSGFLADLELALEGLLEAMSYLGPLRDAPERSYLWTGTIPEDVGWRGENAIQAILAGADRRFNRKPKTRLQSLEQIVGMWLSRLELAASFDVAEIAPERSEYEVRVRTASRQAEVQLTDVGFGVSQVLPVIAQCFYAPPHSTVLMEQPEMHLHPRAQSELGDLLVEAVSARENSAPRGIQFIVESHSEHLLRRVQRHVAEENIDAADVALFFCYPGRPGTGSVIKPLELDEFGEILNWPPEFFGDELKDLVIQTEFGMQRRLRVE